MCLTLVVGRVHAQYYSVNYDKQIVAAMAAAFGAGAMAESYYNEQVGEILKHYNAAEVATAGIFAAKFLERKAFTDLGIWSSSTENYYYRRIHNMVANKIMPKIWTVAGMMLKSPQTALYWGSYLMKICADTKSLCMQFESVVTNSSLTFADIQFLEINQEIAAILKLSEIGNVDWQQLLDDIASVPGNFTVENLTADIETLYNMGASLATAGINGASGALLQQSAFNDLFNGKVSKIIDIYDNYHDLYEQAENGIGSTLLSLVGGEDNVAALFDLSNYNITSWMTDYLSETQGNYYTQRWYIARRDQGSVSLCDYYPPTDDNSILNGDHWYRINTSDPNFYPNSTQREQILANSENHAGWSRSRVQQLNAQSDGFTYTMNYWMSSYIISRGGKQTKKAYAYEIHVTKSWNNVEEVYEDVFDSYSMDLTVILEKALFCADIAVPRLLMLNVFLSGANGKVCVLHELQRSVDRLTELFDIDGFLLLHPSLHLGLSRIKLVCTKIIIGAVGIVQRTEEQIDVGKRIGLTDALTCGMPCNQCLDLVI